MKLERHYPFDVRGVRIVVAGLLSRAYYWVEPSPPPMTWPGGAFERWASHHLQSYLEAYKHAVKGYEEAA